MYRNCFIEKFEVRPLGDAKYQWLTKVSHFFMWCIFTRPLPLQQKNRLRIPSFNAISQPDAHTQVERVGQIAAWCGVKTLVLNRIVPGMAPLRNLLQAKQNFPGNLFISDGLMQIGERSLGGVVLN
jgi:hypothetical protein